MENREIETEACHACGGVALAVREPVEIRLGRRRERVTAERWRCQECDEVFYTGGQLEAAQKAAAEQARLKSKGLPGPAIAHLRRDLGLSQPAFEKLLRSGPKTVVRWERGTVTPNATTSILLEALRELPGFAEYLARKHHVVLHRQRPVADVPTLEYLAGLYTSPAFGSWADPEPLMSEETNRALVEVPSAILRRNHTPAIPADSTFDDVVFPIEQRTVMHGDATQPAPATSGDLS